MHQMILEGPSTCMPISAILTSPHENVIFWTAEHNDAKDRKNAACLRRIYVNRQHFRLRFFASLCSAVQYFWGRRSFQI